VEFTTYDVIKYVIKELVVRVGRLHQHESKRLLLSVVLKLVEPDDYAHEDTEIKNVRVPQGEDSFGQLSIESANSNLQRESKGDGGDIHSCVELIDTVDNVIGELLGLEFNLLLDLWGEVLLGFDSDRE
jgi:hypothetical protein